MLLYLDSFDHYATVDIDEKWTQRYSENALDDEPRYSNWGGPTIAAAGGRRGTNGLYYNGNAGYNFRPATLAIVIPQTDPTIILGFAFNLLEGSFGAMTGGYNTKNLYPSDWGATSSPVGGAMNMLASFRANDGTHIALRLNQSGTLSVVTGIDGLLIADPTAEWIGVVLATTTCALRAGQWYYIEWKATIPDSTEIRVNGDTWLSYTGAGTVSGTYVVPKGPLSNYVTEVTIGHLGGEPVIAYGIDDLYILNGDATDINNTAVDYLGDIEVGYYAPVADDVSDFTPSSGVDNFAMVDEIPPDDDTTTNGTFTAGAVDTFDMTDVSTTDEVLGVQVIYSARRTDGNNTTMQPVFRVAGTNYVTAAKGNTGSFTYHWGLWNKRPSDQAGLTPTIVNAARPGYKKVT